MTQAKPAERRPGVFERYKPNYLDALKNPRSISDNERFLTNSFTSLAAALVTSGRNA
jgi:hypothetical protein